jgi:hypothetical protein
MLTLTLAALLCPDVPVVDLAVLSPAGARTLHGKRVVATFRVGAPSYTWNGSTVTGPGDRGDDIERTAVLSGERVVDVGEKVTVTGRLWVIDHAPAMVGGVFVPGWVEVRVEGER